MQIHHQRRLEDAYLKAKNLGVTAPEMELARKKLHEHAQEALGQALNVDQNATDHHMHVRSLSHAIRQSDDHGHTSPELLQAKKLRADKLKALLEAPETSHDDLQKTHDLLHHARETASGEVAMSIAAAEKRLVATAERILSDHKTTGANSVKALKAAIHICTAESCSNETVLKQAEETLSFEELREHHRKELKKCRQESNMDCMGKWLRGAARLNLNDTDVHEAREHYAQKASEHLREAKAAVTSAGYGANGTTETPVMESKEMRARLLRAKEAGLPEMETKPLQDHLYSLERSRQAKAAAAVVDMTKDGFHTLIEMETCAHLEWTSDMEKADAKKALHTKVTGLLATMTTLPLPAAAKLVAFAARDSMELDPDEVSTHIASLQKRLLPELETASVDPDKDRCQKLKEATTAAGLVLEAARRFPDVLDPAFEQATIAARDVERRWDTAADRVHSLEMAQRQGKMRELRDILDGARRVGVDARYLAPFETAVQDFQTKALAAKGALEIAVTAAKTRGDVDGLEAAIKQAQEAGADIDHGPFVVEAIMLSRELRRKPSSKAAEPSSKGAEL